MNKRWMMLVVAAIVILGPGVAIKAAPAQMSLTALDINPGPVIQQDCRTVELVAYRNGGTAPVQLRSVDLWMGLYRDAYADLAVEVWKRGSGGDDFVTSFREDRYANPNGVHQRYVSFVPDAIEVLPGEAILIHALNCYVAGRHSPMHPIVDLYFGDGAARGGR